MGSGQVKKALVLSGGSHQAFGDRHLACSCPPLSAYQSE